MIYGDPITIGGGGGGGFDPSDALIHVNAPSGSTVTFSKSGVTVQVLYPADAFPNVDGTTADYYYPVKSANYGTWTVTATLSGDTASDTVTVSAAKQYDVELNYKYYLFKSGVGLGENTLYGAYYYQYGPSAWKGANSIITQARIPATISTDRGTTYATLEKFGNDTFGESWVFDNAVDITPWSKLCAEIMRVESTTSSIPIKVGVGTHKVTTWNDNGTFDAVASISYNDLPVNQKYTLECDVSTITGSKNVSVLRFSEGFAVYNVWLE